MVGRKLVCECGECRRCKHRTYMRTWYARNAEKVRASVARYRAENIDGVRASDRERNKGKIRDPRKETARRATRKLPRQPCEVCGAARAEAHHEDYDRPLDVRWLCRTHHMELHRTVAA